MPKTELLVEVAAFADKYGASTHQLRSAVEPLNGQREPSFCVSDLFGLAECMDVDRLQVYPRIYNSKLRACGGEGFALRRGFDNRACGAQPLPHK